MYRRHRGGWRPLWILRLMLTVSAAPVQMGSPDPRRDRRRDRHSDKQIRATTAALTDREMWGVAFLSTRRSHAADMTASGVERSDRSPMTMAGRNLLPLSHGYLGDLARTPALRGYEALASRFGRAGVELESGETRVGLRTTVAVLLFGRRGISAIFGLELQRRRRGRSCASSDSEAKRSSRIAPATLTRERSPGSARSESQDRPCGRWRELGFCQASGWRAWAPV